MSKKQQANAPVNRKPSKRERRMKLAIYVMVGAMLLSTLTAGLVSLF